MIIEAVKQALKDIFTVPAPKEKEGPTFQSGPRGSY